MNHRSETTQPRHTLEREAAAAHAQAVACRHEPWSIECMVCDAGTGIGSAAEAVAAGWTYLQCAHDGPCFTHLGLCPDDCAMLTLMIAGKCEETQPPTAPVTTQLAVGDPMSGESVRVIEHDGCEYLLWTSGGQSGMSHKGNCKNPVHAAPLRVVVLPAER